MIIKKRYENTIRLWVNKFKFEFDKVCFKEYLFPLRVDIFLTFQRKKYKILAVYPYTKKLIRSIYFWSYSLSGRELTNINLLLDNGLSDLIEEQAEIIKKNWDSLSYWESINSKI